MGLGFREYKGMTSNYHDYYDVAADEKMCLSSFVVNRNDAAFNNVNGGYLFLNLPVVRYPFPPLYWGDYRY